MTDEEKKRFERELHAYRRKMREEG